MQRIWAVDSEFFKQAITDRPGSDLSALIVWMIVFLVLSPVLLSSQQDAPQDCGHKHEYLEYYIMYKYLFYEKHILPRRFGGQSCLEVLQ